MKHVIEDQDVYKLFYVEGVPVRRERDLQAAFKIACFGCKSDVNSEVNNGRGPVDYKFSMGANDKTLIEFKLASNTKIRNNLEKQVKIYKRANQTEKAIKVIMYFTEDEAKKFLLWLMKWD